MLNTITDKTKYEKKTHNHTTIYYHNSYAWVSILSFIYFHKE